MDSASYMDNNRDLVQVQACTSCFMHCMICMHDVSLLLASKTNTDPTWSAPHNQEQGCCHWPHHETSKCCATMSTTIGGTYRHNTHRDIQSHTHIQTYKHIYTHIHTHTLIDVEEIHLCNSNAIFCEDCTKIMILI